MNLVYDPVQGAMVRKWVHSGSPFNEVDDALHFHERRYYSAISRNSNDYPAEDQEWVNERARLNALWQEKCPYKADVDPCSIKGAGLLQRIRSFFR
jgi:hypothetical protein